MISHFGIRRREFVLGTVAAAASGAALTPSSAKDLGTPASGTSLPKDLQWKADDALLVHSANTIETKRSHAGRSPITPLEELFVRNNVSPPPPSVVADPDSWSISIEGVKEPAVLTVAELKQIDIESVACVLQCSGNGRKFFDHNPNGTAWTVGAAGCILWTGIPVRSLIQKLGGVASGCQFMTGTGGEPIPEGLDPNTVVVERSVPVDAMEIALLAWEANGKALPLAHGGPLRLVIPGYFGVNNIKYIKKLAFSDVESQARIQANSYRVTPLGGKGSTEFPSMWQMPIKSWIRDPIETTKSGPVQIQGVMFGGEGGASSVEISIDGGASWKPAKLVGPDLGPYAWRNFSFSVDLPPGKHVLASRATDSKGNSQPEHMTPNDRGYAHNGWRAHAITITAT